MRRFAYWLFPLIAAAVAVFIIVLLIQINPSNVESGEILEDHESNGTEHASAFKNSWLDRFSVNEESGYFYPVTEVSLDLDMDGYPTETTTYRMAVHLKNSYDLFCLKQELKNSELSYFMQKEGEAMTLLIDSTDQQQLASLVTKLKTYQITATVSPYKEEK